jgi:hypothetical protein
MAHNKKKPPSKTKTRASRRPYTPPRIEQVEINPGEAMLGFCKTAGGLGSVALCGTVACQGSGS